MEYVVWLYGWGGMCVISLDSSIPRITFPNVFANQNEMKKAGPKRLNTAG